MNGKAAVAAAVAGGLLLGLLVIVGGIFAAQDELDQAACDTFPAVGPGSGAVPAGGVVVAHANIKAGMSAEGWRSDLAKTVATSPDLVSLNEMFQRSVKDVVKAAPGYAGYRDESAKDQERSTMVLWRTDRWSRVDAGRITIVDAGPNKWDAGRSATWVTLEDADGARVSMVSVHHMIDPIASVKRQVIFRAGMVKTGQLMTQLAQQGPVFMAGDLNAHYGRKNADWAPAPVLKPMGFESTFEALGPLQTHRPQGVIDYIFFQPSVAKPTGQDTTRINSDHLVLTAVFDLASSKPGEGSSTPTEEPTGKPGKKGNKGDRPAAAARPVVAAKPGAASPSPSTGAVPTATGKVPDVPGFDAEQVRNAVAVVAAGVELGVPARGQAIAVMTAMGESGLRVLDYGDAVGPDSRGLFQQRDNGAWGTYADRMDPRRSALNFYKALLRVKGWEQMAPTLAAHETQRNADPYHYEKYWDGALKLFTAITGAGAVGAALQGGASNDCDEVVLTAGAGGAVVWPVPASMKGSDRKNWGGTGGSWASKHTGTDFSVPCGVPVFAAHAGTVVIDRHQGWAGPQLVKVSTGPESLTTWYAHMQKVTVPEGTVVTPGQQIGEVGAEGNVSGPTGCHLHFEVHPKNGTIYEDNINPSTWLADNVGKVLPGSAEPIANTGGTGSAGTGGLPSKAQWLADVSTALTGADAYLTNRAGKGGKLAIVLDIDNTSIATHYAWPEAVGPTLTLAQRAAALGMKVFFVTGRFETGTGGVANAVPALQSAGYSWRAICGRKAGEKLAASKKRCRAAIAKQGYTIVANVGNNGPDFAGGNYEKAYRLPNYDGKLS